MHVDFYETYILSTNVSSSTEIAYFLCCSRSSCFLLQHKIAPHSTPPTFDRWFLQQICQHCSAIAFFCYVLSTAATIGLHRSPRSVKVWQLVLGVLIFSSLNLALHWWLLYSCIWQGNPSYIVDITVRFCIHRLSVLIDVPKSLSWFRIELSTYYWFCPS